MTIQEFYKLDLDWLDEAACKAAYYKHQPTGVVAYMAQKEAHKTQHKARCRAQKKAFAKGMRDWRRGDGKEHAIKRDPYDVRGILDAYEEV